jgi:hypothetical protein
MRCPHCDKTISQIDKFCRHCGKPVVAPPPPAPPRPLPGHIGIPIEENDFGPAEILALHSGLTWGAHIYTGHSQDLLEVKERPEGCPEWVEKDDWHTWFRRGLVVWDPVARRIGAMLAGEAIKLLEQLRLGDEWKAHGIGVVERHENQLYVDTPRRAKRSRKKKEAKPEPPAEDPEIKPRFYEKERLRLTGDAAEEFFTYLRANEAQLRHMADEEAALQQKADRILVDLLVEFHHRQELAKFDGAGRQFPWTRQEYPTALICDVPPDRGTITLSEDEFWWLAVIERPGQMKHDDRFLLLEKAVAWVEQQIPELRVQDEEWKKNWEREQAEEKAQLAALPRKDLTLYWIDPADLEPERITYRAMIEVEYVPYHSKTYEISFGEKWHFDKEYYTPTMLARELRINPAQVDIEIPVEGMGWYYIRSVATCLQEPVAAALAQQLWDHSAILDKFREQKVIRARYGYEEVETGYCTWLGVCKNQEKMWSRSESRAEYMAENAMRETLLHALDVNGWRAFIQMPFKYSTDDELLHAMHEVRVESHHQSPEARAESARWLEEHRVSR